MRLWVRFRVFFVQGLGFIKKNLLLRMCKLRSSCRLEGIEAFPAFGDHGSSGEGPQMKEVKLAAKLWLREWF